MRQIPLLRVKTFLSDHQVSELTQFAMLEHEMDKNNWIIHMLKEFIEKVIDERN